MVNADRQTIMEANRSLRNIKNELENLLEKGVIDESVYDQIHSTLPAESPLSGPLRTAGQTTATPAAAAIPTPARSQNPTPAPQSETVLFDSRNEKAASPFQHAQPSPSPAPPAYQAAPSPAPPPRNEKQSFIAHCVARYDYNTNDRQPTGPNDIKFWKGDRIGVTEYKNPDWWMGKNLTRGHAGIFPQNHVEMEDNKGPSGPPHGYPPQQPQYGYPQQHQPHNGPPPQQNPYNSSVPPMAIADGNGQQQQGEGEGSGKAGQYGKKFGKKLGNAAIFGAGATIGGNIVNSIF